MSKPSQVIVLVEDRRQQRLVHGYLTRLGYKGHEVRDVALPPGGSGEQCVRTQYPIQVRAFRWRGARAETALVVVIDADKNEVEYRSRQLRNAAADLNERAANERIVHLIPKRNIETWILCLSGRDVDELTDYTRESDVDELIRNAAHVLYESARQNTDPPARCVSSLKAAIPELRRLE